jgi:hypothetical protein
MKYNVWKKNNTMTLPSAIYGSPAVDENNKKTDILKDYSITNGG